MCIEIQTIINIYQFNWLHFTYIFHFFKLLLFSNQQSVIIQHLIMLNLIIYTTVLNKKLTTQFVSVQLR